MPLAAATLEDGVLSSAESPLVVRENFGDVNELPDGLLPWRASLPMLATPSLLSLLVLLIRRAT